MKTISILLAIGFFVSHASAGVEMSSAKLYRKQGEWVKAVEFYTRALEKDPADLEGYWERGSLYGEIAADSSRAEIAKQLAGDAADPQKELYTRMAADFALARDAKTPDQEKALKKFGKKMDTFVNQRWDSFYFSAVAIDSPYAKLTADHLASEQVQFSDRTEPSAEIRQKLNSALDKLNMAILVIPTKWNAYGQRAQILEKLGPLGEANVAWDSALVLIQKSDMSRKEPDNYVQALKVIRQHLLQNTYDLGKYPETVIIASDILATDPESVDAVQYKAFALAKMSVDTTKTQAERDGFKRDAIKALDEARTKTDDPIIVYYMGQFYLELGDTSNALKSFGEYLLQEPKDKDVLFAVGVLYLQGGTFMDLPKARDTFKALTEAEPEFGPGWINYGVAEVQLGNIDIGREAIEKGQKLGR